MTLLSVVQDVCAPVGVIQPTSIFSNISGNRTMQEMLALANEMAQRISYDTRDWTKFKSLVTLQGDGTTTAFNLPADFKRMLLTSNVWRSTNARVPMRFVPDFDEWIMRRNLHVYDPYGEWMITGDQINIVPPMGTTVTATFGYLQKNCVALASGGFGDSFQNDGDSFRLNERLLKLGMIFQWKAQKGSAYAEDMSTFADALTNEMGHDSPAPIIIGRLPVSVVARVAYPFPVPTSTP